jgi:hypothetical protein
MCLMFGSLLLVNENVKAQAFQKGNLNIDLGVGFGVYGGTSKFSIKSDVFSVSLKESAGAISGIFPLGIEYGVGEKIGVGLDLLINNYYVGSNDTDAVPSKYRSIDIGGKFNYHLLNAAKNDLFISLGLGYSKLNITWKPNEDVESSSASGISYSIGITDRIFFTDHIGISFNIGYRGYSYSSIKSELTSETKKELEDIPDFRTSWSMSLSGVHLGTGLVVKF